MIHIDLTGSTVLVTGTTGGLGSAIARRFLDAGATVVAHRRTDAGMPSTDAQEHDRLTVVSGDLENDGFVATMFARRYAGRTVNVLVNCAGTYPSQSLVDTSRHDFDAVVGGNVGITFSCLREAARTMRAGGTGCIINIASLNATRPALDQAAYNAGKAAVVGLTRSAASELAGSGIRVNSISPGLIDRPGLTSAWPEGVSSWQERCPLGRLGTPEDVANACVFLASPLASWITGQDLLVDGGMTSAPAY